MSLSPEDADLLEPLQALVDALHHLLGGEVLALPVLSHSGPKEAVINEECAANECYQQSQRCGIFPEQQTENDQGDEPIAEQSLTTAARHLETGRSTLARSERTQRSYAAGRPGRAGADKRASGGCEGGSVGSVQSR